MLIRLQISFIKIIEDYLKDWHSPSEAVSLTVPLHQFYANSHKAQPQSWTYIQDELFIPMRPELRRDIGDSVS